jgi:phosphate-selective porin OprO/OprP
MYNKFKLAALAAFVAAAGVAHADPAETKGGIKIKTDDGRFEANIGGRIHFDYNSISTDSNSVFGSQDAYKQPIQNDGAYLRRVYLTLKGKAYGWNYKIEPDFAGNNGTGAASIAFQDVYLSTQFGPGEIIFGQIKPFRAMEELTSSNDILFAERPYAGATGLFAGGVSREFQQGVYYKGEYNLLGAGTYGVGVYSLRRDNTPSNSGIGSSARVTFAPILTDDTVVHVGLSYSYEAQDKLNASDSGSAVIGGGSTNQLGAAAIGSNIRYLSRRGPQLSLGSASGPGGSNIAYTVGGELAGKLGPAYFQSEYFTQTLEGAAGLRDQYVNAYYVQASYFITGESKTYKKADGFFGGIKPNSSYGAFEVKVRYDSASNNALSIAGATGTIAGPAARTPAAAPTTTVNYGKASVDAISAGVNWYVNPNVRFMLEYITSEAERTLTASGAVQKDKPDAVVARAQFSF